MGAAGNLVLDPDSSTLAPWLPGRYLVRVSLPAGFTSGEVALQVGQTVSASRLF